MGNEESQYRKLEIEDKSIEVTNHWSLHNAREIDGNAPIQSAFIGEVNLSEGSSTLLEKLAKNLMLHRHPYIVKYISSWTRNNKFHLISEKVEPLTLVLPNQSPLQICIGLHNILSAIIFLHEKAQSSHNNICCASIYVTSEGIWKLGGLEYLTRFSDLTKNFLKESRRERYEKGVAPEEDSVIINAKVNGAAIDKYAFGIMVEELFRKKSNSPIPYLGEFLDYCKKQLQASDPVKRVDLTEVIRHPFFNHDFIRISKFLFDLPLKTTSEKEHFFSELINQLYLLPEDVVASQLTSLLLSRMVILDSAAQKHLLSVLLQPKTDDKQNKIALFTEEIFKKYIVPKLLKIFCVRDLHIRLILLENFHLFCNAFNLDELKNHVLPELLVGIKDVNDLLVSKTLSALSQSVMILGASTVIGGKRGKLFADGRPKSQLIQSSEKDESACKEKPLFNSINSVPEVIYKNNGLPERPSPDGGEEKYSSSSCEEAENVEAEHWSDWDMPAEKNSMEVIPKQINDNSTVEMIAKIDALKKESSDITFLDIKSTTNESVKSSSIDFFHDMVPVISKTQILDIKPSKTKFDVESDDAGTNWEGWGGDWELEEEKAWEKNLNG